MVDIPLDRDTAISRCQSAHGTELQMFTDGSMKNGRVGYGIVVWADGYPKTEIRRTIGTDDMVNVYIAELGAIMEAVEWAETMLRFSTGTWGLQSTQITCRHSRQSLNRDIRVVSF